MLLVTMVLTLGVTFVNGWTDAPNAIATSISTRSIGVRPAILMAAVCNLFGVLVMSAFNSSVAFTIKNVANFGTDTHKALIALCAATAAIVIWAIGAWVFGIPTSESHALVAGLSGAAIALNGGIEGINLHEWLKVLEGLIFSAVLGFVFGFLICRVVVIIFSHIPAQKTNSFFQYAQVGAGAAMAFMHGAQDGQKFMGVMLLGIFLCNDIDQTSAVSIPFWMILLISLTMGVGTSIGGKKIIKSVGMDMVRLKKYQGFSSDLAAALCLLFMTILGMPVSTTQVKTASVMGAGAERRLSAVKMNVVKDMVFTWICTFPGCGVIGYFMAKLFLRMF
ncbi:MAG: inorganic phosphate transporter [Oscillospiraceae bacterium]|nr:inorganic phosphate transporter [Oscillospiraceae bacterium]